MFTKNLGDIQISNFHEIQNALGAGKPGMHTSWRFGVFSSWHKVKEVTELQKPHQSGQTKRATPALSRVTPNNVLGLPWYIVRGYPIQCLHTAPGNVGTMFLHCPGQCGDIVSALPLIWGTMWRHCTRTAPHLGGSAETLYPHCPGQYRDNSHWHCRDIVWSTP